jgi:uncharacterized glyoxalase superfamily protein PhnB
MGDGPQIIPYLYYPSAAEALDFLTRAFSFEVVSEVRDKEGTGGPPRSASATVS